MKKTVRLRQILECWRGMAFRVKALFRVFFCRKFWGPDSKLLQKWEELSFKHYLDTMEEGWLYFLMGWISVAPMVLPGHCLLPTVWLGGRWQQSSLHSRRGPYGPMWSLRFCFLWQMSCCDSGMVLRTRVTRVMTRENGQDSPRWYPSPVHQSDYKVTNMTKWPALRALGARCIIQAGGWSGRDVAEPSESTEVLSVPLLMIGWKHWNPEQLGLALRQEIRGDPRRSEEIRGQNYGISVHFLQAAAARAELLTLRHLAKTTKKCPKCRAPRNVCKWQRQNLKVK